MAAVIALSIIAYVLFSVAEVVVGPVKVLKFIFEKLTAWNWRELSEQVFQTVHGELVKVLLNTIFKCVIELNCFCRTSIFYLVSFEQKSRISLGRFRIFRVFRQIINCHILVDFTNKGLSMKLLRALNPFLYLSTFIE